MIAHTTYRTLNSLRPKACRNLSKLTTMQNTDRALGQTKISEGEDEYQVKADLESLVGNGWELTEEQLLSKTFFFKTYTKVLVTRSSLLIKFVSWS